jgi:type I restriction-modification system DNA methylase subunit
MSINDNLRAIALLKNLQAEKREPNKEEKDTLSKFNGWGAMWQIFKPDHPDHSNLKSLLTTEEFAQANASILNAHYTHPDIIKAMWEAVTHLGFDRGKVLEPSCGIGYFMSHAPKWNLWTAVELDPIPAHIAYYLNPSATIYNQGFEKISLPDGYFDMAIGNVPFGSYSVFEPRYDGLLIHNHFISKSIDLVREGGLIALITSTGTLDAEGNKEFRRSLSEKATLIAAIRMPGGTMSNAKTQVTTDLLIFKREPEPDAKWIETGEILGLPINQYFIDHPEHLLGEVCLDKLYGNDRLALKGDGRDIPMAIAEAIQKIKPCYSAKPTNQDILLIPRELQHLPVNSFCIWNQEIYQRQQGKLTHTPKGERIQANLEILDIIEELLDRQLYETDDALSNLREKLNNQYDKFVRKYGYLSSDGNKSEFGKDPRYGLLCSLEMNGRKAPIFTQRTTRGYTVPSKCASPKDALVHCLNVKGKVDLDWISARVK